METLCLLYVLTACAAPAEIIGRDPEIIIKTSPEDVPQDSQAWSLNQDGLDLWADPDRSSKDVHSP